MARRKNVEVSQDTDGKPNLFSKLLAVARLGGFGEKEKKRKRGDKSLNRAIEAQFSSGDLLRQNQEEDRQKVAAYISGLQALVRQSTLNITNEGGLNLDFYRLLGIDNPLWVNEAHFHQRTRFVVAQYLEKVVRPEPTGLANAEANLEPDRIAAMYPGQIEIIQSLRSVFINAQLFITDDDKRQGYNTFRREVYEKTQKITYRVSASVSKQMENDRVFTINFYSALTTLSLCGSLPRFANLLENMMDAYGLIIFVNGIEYGRKELSVLIANIKKQINYQPGYHMHEKPDSTLFPNLFLLRELVDADLAQKQSEHRRQQQDDFGWTPG